MIYIMKDGKKVDKFVIIECLLIGYIIITSIVNLLNITGIINFSRGIMKATFWGPSMLICFIIQYRLVSINRKQVFGDKIRPLIMGVIVANIFSTCRMPYCLFLLLIVGCYMQIGAKRCCNIRKSMLVVLYACIGIEIYSVLFLLQREKAIGEIGEFMISYHLDMLFMFVSVVYGIIIYIDTSYKNRQEIGLEIIDIEEENIEGHILSQKGNKCFRIWDLIVSAYDKVNLNAEKIVYLFGLIFCACAIGLFGLYSVTISTGEERIRNSEEEVYLIQHSEDTSLVLTLIEDKDSYRVGFEKYVGTNNQKLEIVDVGEGKFQYIFLEPRMALEVSVDAESGEEVLTVGEVSDKEAQKWNKGFWYEIDGFYMVTRLTKDNGTPIYFQTLLQAEDNMPQVFFGKNEWGYEYFPMERTISNEFITETIALYKKDFTPTAMLGINIERFSGGSYLLFFVIAAIFVGIIYSRRIVGDKCGLLYALLFIFLLAYGAISVILVFLLAFGGQVYYRLYNRREMIKGASS